MTEPTRTIAEAAVAFDSEHPPPPGPVSPGQVSGTLRCGAPSQSHDPPLSFMSSAPHRPRGDRDAMPTVRNQPTPRPSEAPLRIEVEAGLWLDLRPGAYQDEDGVDLSLIDRCLDLTPYERVAALRGFADLLAAAEAAASPADDDGA